MECGVNNMPNSQKTFLCQTGFLLQKQGERKPSLQLIHPRMYEIYPERRFHELDILIHIFLMTLKCVGAHARFLRLGSGPSQILVVSFGDVSNPFFGYLSNANANCPVVPLQPFIYVKKNIILSAFVLPTSGFFSWEKIWHHYCSWQFIIRLDETPHEFI